jgi:hypothetical protein
MRLHPDTPVQSGMQKNQITFTATSEEFFITQMYADTVSILVPNIGELSMP